MAIHNMGSVPLSQQQMGTVPNVAGGFADYYQPMVFETVGKIVNGFMLEETGNPLNFRGVIQPLTNRQLYLKPEGQRAWTWFMLHSDPALVLNVDDVVIWRGKQTRVMSRKDYAMYGYIYYELCQDWTGSGP